MTKQFFFMWQQRIVPSIHIRLIFFPQGCLRPRRDRGDERAALLRGKQWFDEQWRNASRYQRVRRPSPLQRAVWMWQSQKGISMKPACGHLGKQSLLFSCESQLHMRVCPSVRRSVRPLVTRFFSATEFTIPWRTIRHGGCRVSVCVCVCPGANFASG